MNTNIAKVDFVSDVESLASGLQSLPDTSFVLATVTYQKADIIQACNTYVAAVDATKSSKTDYEKNLAVERTALAVIRNLRTLLKPVLVARFGKSSPELKTFGMAPAKPRVVTVVAKMAGAQKSQNTRKELHTMGPKQKKAAKKAAVAPVAVVAPSKGSSNGGG
jgi:hypothetical protein